MSVTKSSSGSLTGGLSCKPDEKQTWASSTPSATDRGFLTLPYSNRANPLIGERYDV